MIEGTSKPFEEQFNTWYKKFLTEEASMNKEIKTIQKINFLFKLLYYKF